MCCYWICISEHCKFFVENRNNSQCSKTLVVTAIPKISGTKKDFIPIISLVTVEKLLETVVHKQLTKHLFRNKLLNSSQSGFREEFSCETPLQKILNEFQCSLEDGLVVIVNRPLF